MNIDWLRSLTDTRGVVVCQSAMTGKPIYEGRHPRGYVYTVNRTQFCIGKDSTYGWSMWLVLEDTVSKLHYLTSARTKKSLVGLLEEAIIDPQLEGAA